MITKLNIVMIVFEYMYMIGFIHFITPSGWPYSIDDVISLTVIILRRRYYFEAAGYVHRDTAARNCLVKCGEGNADGEGNS